MTFNNINSRQIAAITLTLETTIAFCEENGLIPIQKICHVCGNLMRKKIKNNTKVGIVFRCGRKICGKEVSILKNTFFENSNVRIEDVLLFLYYWCFEICSFKYIKRELGWGEHPFVDFRSYLREVCAIKLFENEDIIGGEGKVVEIDESLFVKRKYNVGRFSSYQWVFGGKERGSKKCFLVPVANRDKLTLMEIIFLKIAPGTTIMSDCWAAYNDIVNFGYEHFTVNHSYNFVDQDSRAHTQNVENMWGRAKRRNKKENGTAPHLLDSYLQEFMWRELYGDDVFGNMILHISEVYNGLNI